MKKIILVLFAMFMLVSAYGLDIKVSVPEGGRWGSVIKKPILKDNWRKSLQNNSYCCGDHTDFYVLTAYETEYDPSIMIIEIYFYGPNDLPIDAYTIDLPKKEAEVVIDKIIHNETPDIIFRKTSRY